MKTLCALLFILITSVTAMALYYKKRTNSNLFKDLYADIKALLNK